MNPRLYEIVRLHQVMVTEEVYNIDPEVAIWCEKSRSLLNKTKAFF